MTSLYPNAIDGYAQLPLVVDGSTKIDAASVNRLRSAIANIEEELGVLPSGDYNTLSERVGIIEATVQELEALIDIAGGGLHGTRHEAGGADEISILNLSGEAADPQKVSVKNAGTLVGSRSSLNLIEGSGVTLSIVDDAVENEVDITISSAAGGDVSGPASSTDNAVARFDLGTGKLIQNSGILIDDSDAITGVTSITVENGGVLRTGTAPSDTLLLQAYRSGVFPAYVTFATLTSGIIATMDLSTSVTVGGSTIATSGGAFHDGFSDYVANEHIDHSAVTFTAGVGLAGGGTIASDRTFTLAVNELSEKSGALIGSDRLTGTSGVANFSETISGIPLSIFNNDAGWTSSSGTVDTSGTPLNNQIAIFTDSDTIEGDSSLTWDGTSFNIATSRNFQIAGTTILADAAGTTTLSGIDALDATTEATIEAAIDTLSNLTSASSLATVGTITVGTWQGTDVGVSHGGTGASDAGTARSNLSAAESGANSDITSMTGMTGQLGTPDTIIMANGGAIRSLNVDTNSFTIQARDIDGASWTTFATVTSANTPTMDLSTAVTIGGNKIVEGEASGLGDEMITYSGTSGRVIQGIGVRNFGPADTASEPTGSTSGDMYYNTDNDMWMTYDSTRSKWLSVEVAEIHFGNSGDTAAASYYNGIAGEVFSSTTGRDAEWDGTVVSISYTRSDTDSATFEVVAGGSATGAELASSATSGNSTTLNSDFSQGAVLAVRNKTGGNTTSDVMGVVRVRWRAT